MSDQEGAVSEESKSDKFTRLATKRVEKAVKSIDLLGNLSTSQYEYTQEQIDQIISDLAQHLNEVKAKYQKRLDRINR